MSDRPAASQSLPPLRDSVHVWDIALDDASCEIDSCALLISPQERAQAEKFRFDHLRRRYVIAHAALRDILAHYAPGEAANLSFTANRNGKPRLAPPFDASGIEFNLSHSHERALVAVGCRGEIGIDLEYVKTDFTILEVARRFFTGGEVAALYDLPEALRIQAFYKCWTSKEAFLKAKGTGLSGALDEVQIALEQEQVRIRAAVPGWQLRDLDRRDGYEGALVTPEQPFKVLSYRWRRSR